MDLNYPKNDDEAANQSNSRAKLFADYLETLLIPQGRMVGKQLVNEELANEGLANEELVNEELVDKKSFKKNLLESLNAIEQALVENNKLLQEIIDKKIV